LATIFPTQEKSPSSYNLKKDSLLASGRSDRNAVDRFNRCVLASLAYLHGFTVRLGTCIQQLNARRTADRASTATARRQAPEDAASFCFDHCVWQPLVRWWSWCSSWCTTSSYGSWYDI